MTMKVNRFWSFFNFTKAPVTGRPDASFTTPVTVPLFCADATDETAISTAPVAIPTARLRETFLSDIWLLLVAHTMILGKWLDRGDSESDQSSPVGFAVRGGFPKGFPVHRE